MTEIIGLTSTQVEALRDAPGGRDVLPIVAATLRAKPARWPSLT